MIWGGLFDAQGEKERGGELTIEMKAQKLAGGEKTPRKSNHSKSLHFSKFFFSIGSGVRKRIFRSEIATKGAVMLLRLDSDSPGMLWIQFARGEELITLPSFFIGRPWRQSEPTSLLSHQYSRSGLASPLLYRSFSSVNCECKFSRDKGKDQPWSASSSSIFNPANSWLFTGWPQVRIIRYSSLLACFFHVSNRQSSSASLCDRPIVAALRRINLT